MNYKNVAQKYKDKIIKDLVDFIKIDSVYSEKTISKEKPFGENVAKALEYMAHQAELDGMEVDRCDGYCTEITIGSGDELILIAAHADTVPYSSDWDALSGEVKNGLVFGRGSQDDKGPAIVCYNVLKAIKDLNIKLNKKIRLVIGGNEESGSRCLKYYFNDLKKQQPNYAFTPDADFPLIYGEKGIANVKISGNIKLNKLISLTSGDALNSVPDSSEIIVRKGAITPTDLTLFLDAFNLKGYLKNQNNVSDKIVIYGKSSHGAAPMNGVNALIYSLKLLGTHLSIDELGLFAYFFEDCYGKNLNINSIGTELRDLTINLGLGKIKNNKYEFYLNIRYPETCEADNIKNKIITALYKLKPNVELFGDVKPLLIDPNSKLVNVLLKAYQEITNDFSSKILTIGGGTYARNIQNCLAFGMSFPETPNKMHQKDEAIPINDLLDGFAIYMKAILDLNEN